MEPPSVEQCRVLELGCGDGTNLLAMALGLPNSRFLGIDIARQPLETGIALAKTLGLTNLELRCEDLLTLGPSLGKFDYIVIPGLYSWVPENVRDKLLELCGQCLAENGVATLSYNVYPGAYASTMVRDMMAYHVRAITDPTKKVRQARGLLHILLKCQNESNAFKFTLQEEMKRISNYPDAVLNHDDLNPHYHPVFFHEFIQHASRHGLQYLGERCEATLDPDEYPEEVRPTLGQLEKAGVIEREQYLDFIQRRRFRCTLLCLEDATTTYIDDTQQIGKLFVGISKDIEMNIVIDPNSGITFESENQSIATTTHPLLVAAVSHLHAVHPRSVPFGELLKISCSSQTLPSEARTDVGKDFGILSAFVLRCHKSRLLDLRTCEPHFENRPSERPVASPLARAKVRQGRFVPNLRHDSVAFDDELGRRLLELLDGTRNRSDLLRELNKSVASGISALPEGQSCVTPELLEEKLAALAQMALLAG